MNTGVKIFLISLCVYFLSWLGLYVTGINTLPIQSEDTVPAMFLPYSIIQDRTLYLDKFYQQMILRYPQPDDKDYQKGNVPFYLKKVGTHYLSAFTIITPILAVPVYLLPVLAGVTPTWENLIVLSHLSSAVIMALAGVYFYKLIQRSFLNNEKKSLILTVVYMFGTVNFALISQALWQHGTVQLMIILALYHFYDPKINHLKLVLSGLFFGLAFLTRPTAALPIVSLIFFYAYKNRVSGALCVLRGLLFLGVGLLLNAVFFIWYNATFYLSFENQGYYSQAAGSWRGNFPESFLGIWMSPNKGILVFSPVLLFMFVGMYLAYRQWKTRTDTVDSIDILLFGSVVLLHTLVMSFWKHWYGGWSFGYRMSSDVIPFMVLVIIPFMRSQLYDRYKKIFLGLLIFSIVVQIYGLIFFDGIWHAAYDRGFKDTSWVWSVRDSEFLFNIRRIMVKAGLMKQACPECFPR